MTACSVMSTNLEETGRVLPLQVWLSISKMPYVIRPVPESFIRCDDAEFVEGPFKIATNPVDGHSNSTNA